MKGLHIAIATAAILGKIAFTDPAYALQPPALLEGAAVLDTSYYYQAVPGKNLGVWPSWASGYTLEQLSDLRTRYGFTHIVVVPDTQIYNSASRAGFAPASMMIDIWDLHATVDSFPAAYYYKDEPVEHDCSGNSGGATPPFSQAQLASYRDYVHQNRPTSQFVISGYKRCSHNIIAATYAEAVMYSAYQNWDFISLPIQCHVNMGWGDEYETPWLPGNQDQSNSWISMRATYGNKYYMTWINGASDEYPTLFAAANSLGLVGIWQWYPGPIDSANLELYCNAAWQNGWLTRIPRIPVPVQLSSFTAELVGNGRVLLRWVTLSETDNLGFEVQRRSGSSGSFSTVPNGFVSGNGTTLKTHDYSFLDSTAGAGMWVYRLKQVDASGAVWYGPERQVSLLTTVGNQAGPRGFQLLQNYPNPFNPATIIQLSIMNSQFITLQVFDLLGREVATLVDGETAAGSHTVTFEGAGLAGGVYVYQLQAGSTVETRKMMLIK